LQQKIGIGKVSPSSGKYAQVALILCSLNQSSYGPQQLPFSWDQPGLQAPISSIISFKIRENKRNLTKKFVHNP
jgi:hypothetical protein